MLIIYILLLPVLIGYLLGTTTYFREKSERVWWSLEHTIQKGKLLPKKIKYEIKRQAAIRKQNQFMDEELPDAIEQSRDPVPTEDAKQAIAKRLSHIKHSQWTKTMKKIPQRKLPRWMCKIISLIWR